MSSDNIAQPRVEDVTEAVSVPAPVPAPTPATASAPAVSAPNTVPTPAPNTVPTSTPTVPTPVPVPVQAPQPEFYNLSDAIKAVSRFYERDFPKLSFNTPAQITDGCVVEFIDTSMGVTVATARVRVRNRLIVNNENGDIFLQVQLSDFAFSRSSVAVTSK